MGFLLGYILIGLIVVILAFLIILRITEKRLRKKVFAGKNSRNRFYYTKLSKVNISDRKKLISGINKIAKSFFMEAFKTRGTEDYSQLSRFFKEKNNKKAIEFCEIMTKELYSKELKDKKNLQKPLNLLGELISKNRIISKDEKKELDKKSRKPKTKQNIPPQVPIKTSKPLRQVDVPSAGKKKL